MESSNSGTKKERKPLLALTAAFLMPGLGQLYNGEYSKGLTFFLSFAFVLPVAAWLGLHGPALMLSLFVLAGVLLALVINVLAIVDAYRSAKRIGPAFKLTPLNKPSAYAAILFFGYVFVLNQMVHFTKAELIEAYKIPSSSMIPSLLPGDHLFVDKRPHMPKRGELAIFVNPNNRTQMYAKRVIGLPGDKIEIAGTVLSVNGQVVQREPVSDLGSSSLNRLLEDHVAIREQGEAGSYVVLWKKSAKRDNQAQTIVVPNGHVFAIGDNRDASNDSRHVGPVPLVDVVARARQVWLSFSGDEGIRWGRFGKRVE